jgi:hypothetical protein
VAGRTVAQKLQIKPGAAVWVSDGAWAALLEPFPDAVTQAGRIEDAAAAVLFVEDEAALREMLAELGAERLAAPEVLWIAYRKGNRSDLNRDSLWPILAPLGMRPVTQIAVDEEWSALRFRPVRPGETRFSGGRE